MTYLPPRIEIYQQLQRLGAPLTTPLMPFCIVGPAMKVKDTAYSQEQYASEYAGEKMKVLFTNVGGAKSLLQREGAQVDLLVFKKSPTTNLKLADIEVVQDDWDAPYGTAKVDGGAGYTAAVDAAASPSSITFAADPTWGAGVKFKVVGGANDGKVFTVASNVAAVYAVTETNVTTQASPAGNANRQVVTESGMSIAFDTGVGAATVYTGTPTFYVKINTEVIEVSVNTWSNPPTNTEGSLTVLPASSTRPTGGRGSRNTIPSVHYHADAVQVLGNNVYYNRATKTIGNLTAAQINSIDEGNIILKAAFDTYPNFASGADSRAYVVSKYAPSVGIDIHKNAISLDTDLNFDVALNRDPADENDFFNIFSGIVTVVGVIKARSAYEEDFVPNDAIGDYLGDLRDDSILLPSAMDDRYGQTITDAIIHSSYTVYETSLNKGANIANVPILLTQLSDVEKYYVSSGDTIRPENPLAYAAMLALASGTAGYAIAIESDNLVGYNKAIEMLQEIPCYAVAILTEDTNTITSLKAHVNSMSTGPTSRWRVGIVSGDNLDRQVAKIGYCPGTIYPDDSGALTRFAFYPEAVASIFENDSLRVDDTDTPEANGDYAIVDVAAGATPGNVANVGIIGSFYPLADSFNIASMDSSPKSVTFAAADDPVFAVGDKFYISSPLSINNIGWYEVDSITSAPVYEVTKLTGLTMVDQATSGGRATKSQNLGSAVYGLNSSKSIARQASNLAKSISDRRVFNIFPNKVVVEDPDVLPGYFAAAAFAGQVAATPGPLPFNEANVPGVIRVYGSSDIMGYEDLNMVAEGGNMILYSAAVGAVPTIREQLTTNMDSILTSQISLAVNIDFISYTLKNVLEPLKGKYNIDVDLLNSLKLFTQSTLSYFTTSLGGKRLVSFTDPIITSQPENGCVIINSELKMSSVGRIFKVVLNLTV